MSQPSTTTVRPSLLYLGIILTMLSWGVSWPSGKVLSGYGSPISLGFLRFVFVFITLLPIMVVLRLDLKVARQGMGLLLISGILLAAYNLLFLQGLKVGFAGAGSVLLTTLNPVMAYALGLFLERRAPNRYEAFGLLAGLAAGFFLLKLWSSYQEIRAAGNLYFLAAAAVWAVLSKLTSSARHYGASISFSLWMYLITVGAIGLVTDFTDVGHMLTTGDLRFWANMVLFSFIVTTLATTFYFFATTQLGAERAGSFIFLVPAAGAFSAWLFLDEQIYSHTIIGGLLGIFAVYQLNRVGKQRSRI